jgi:hypothetical protein
LKSIKDENEKGLPLTLRLNTPVNTRKSFARIIRLFARHEIEGDYYRALIYGLSQYLNAWKLEKDLELESRILKLEDKIEKL